MTADRTGNASPMHSEHFPEPHIERATCPTCQAQFMRSRPWQKFCSPKCRNEYHEKHAGQVPASYTLELQTTILCGKCSLSFIVFGRNSNVVAPASNAKLYCPYCGIVNQLSKPA